MLRYCPLVLLAVAAPLSARDSLGVFDDWGAFRDAEVPRCYAITSPDEPKGRDYVPYASVGTWPASAVRGQIHFRLSRQARASSAISLRVGARRFQLSGGGGDAWAQDREMDAAIVAAMRSGGKMYLSARDTAGRRFTDSYSLEGAATAMDAATVACSRAQ